MEKQKDHKGGAKVEVGGKKGLPKRGQRSSDSQGV
jgi:hypothetical protein